MSSEEKTVKSRLRVGVLSFAHTHALSYIAVLQGLPDVEVLATDPGAWGPRDDRGRELAQRLGVNYVDSIDDLLAWAPDAVIVTSENALHREHVERVAAAGAHVLCEKPIATSMEDAYAIRSAIERAGVTLTVAYPVRFAAAFREVRQAHAAGRLGQVFAIRGSNNGKVPRDRDWFTNPALSGGGALLDHVVHIADLVDGLLGANPISVTAIANSKLHDLAHDVETAGLVTVEYDDGVIAAIDCSWSRPETAPLWGGLQLSIAGTGGTVDIDFFGKHVGGLLAESGLPIELSYAEGTDEEFVREFLSGIRDGTQAQPDVEVGIRTLAVALAAQESARTGTTVAISRAADGVLTVGAGSAVE